MIGFNMKNGYSPGKENVMTGKQTKQQRVWEAFMATVIQRGQELGQIWSDIEARVIDNLIIGAFQGTKFIPLRIVNSICSNNGMRLKPFS